MTDRRLGRTIRARRRERGDTLAAVATASGLSTAFLSQLENDRARPSLDSLQRVADALGTTAVDLLAAADQAQEVDVVRADEEQLVQREVDSPADGATGPDGADRPSLDRHSATVRPLVRGHRQLHALAFTGGLDHQEREFVHRNDELMYVVAGSVVVTAAGADTTLRVGDTLYCPGGVQHRWRAESVDTELLVVAVSERARITLPDS